MKAAVFYGPRDIRTEEVDKPKIQDNEILIKVKACGICGSDLHMYKLNMFTLILVRHLAKGGIPGHEFSGVVEEVGPQVRELKEGDRVVSFNNGGMAEYVPVPVYEGYNIYKIPSEVSYEEAATLEPLSNSYHALMKGNPSKEDNVVIFGAGTIGLGIIQCLKALDISTNKLIVIDLSDHRLNTAKQLGADDVINARKNNPRIRINKLVESIPLPQAAEIKMPKVDVIYDCVGYMKDQKGPLVLQQAIDMASVGTGRIVIHGIFEDTVSLNLVALVSKQITVMGSFGFNPDEVQSCIELLQTKKVDQSKIISHEFPLDKAKEAFETQCKTDESIKVLIKP
ncbi:MAG: zinc-binding dehydrogenase [Candidatus Thorarchaeota archaeon]